MVVVAGAYLYDVTDPLHPRLVCSASNTYIQLTGAGKLAYTVPISGGKAEIVWRDLVTGVNTKAVLLPALPRGAKDWTFDGLQVYAGPGKRLDDYNELVPVHLASNGTDHVLYSITSGVGGWESRWSPYPILDFSPSHTYVAISDSRFAITSSGLHIFSVADRRQLLVTVQGNGGTWLANDRFVWPSGTTGSLVQWTPQGGMAAFRPEKGFYGLTSSPDARWLAGTVPSTSQEADVLILPAGAGTAVKKRLGSAPQFVSATVLWYAGEKVCADSDPCGYDPSTPNGTVHAFDVTTNTDTVVRFGTGEAPAFCCSAWL
jgi:hypothetical protein